MDIKELKAKRLYTSNSSNITANSLFSRLLNKKIIKSNLLIFPEEREMH